MDSIKTLMDKQEYNLVLKLTETSTDVDEIFYRISAFLALGKGENALECLLKNQKKLQKRLAFLIRCHIDLLCILGRFDEAYDALDYYKNLPYESQEVEDLLSVMRDVIRDEEKKSFSKSTISNDEIKKLLVSDDRNQLLTAIDAACTNGVDAFYNEFKKLFIDCPYQSIRSFALMMMVSKKIHQEFLFKSRHGIINVVPADLVPPFVGEPFNSIVKRMANEFKNPSLSDNATDILSSYLILIYPDEIDIEEDYLVGALYFISAEFLQMKDIESKEEYCAKHKIDNIKLLETLELLAKAMLEF